MKSSPTPQEIKEARRNAGLTQTKAAHMIGKTCRTWQMYEAGSLAMGPALWELFQIKIAALAASN